MTNVYVPSWIALEAEALRRKCLKEIAPHGPSPAVEGILPSAIEQIAVAREAFTDDARAGVSQMLIALSGGGAALIAALALLKDNRPAFVIGCILAAIAFFAVVPIWRVVRHKLEAGYDFYIAAAVYATIVAVAMEAPLVHRWMIFVIDCCKVSGRFVPKRNKLTGECEPDAYERFVRGDGVQQAQTAGQVSIVWRANAMNLYGIYSALIRWALIAGIVGAVFAILLMCCPWIAPPSAVPNPTPPSPH